MPNRIKIGLALDALAIAVWPGKLKNSVISTLTKLASFVIMNLIADVRKII
jgi:hypothetical protein